MNDPSSLCAIRFCKDSNVLTTFGSVPDKPFELTSNCLR